MTLINFNMFLPPVKKKEKQVCPKEFRIEKDGNGAGGTEEQNYLSQPHSGLVAELAESLLRAGTAVLSYAELELLTGL